MREDQERVKARNLQTFDHLASDGTPLRSLRIGDEEELRAFCQVMVKRGSMTEDAAKRLFLSCRNELEGGKPVWVDVELTPLKTVRGAYN